MAGRKPYVYQQRLFKGWCGPAVLSMGLVSLGIEASQEDLAKAAPYDPDWGTDHQAMLNGARHFVKDSCEMVGKSLSELAEIGRKSVVILNFMDTEIGHEPLHGSGNGEDGHYVLLNKLTKKYIYVVDPNPISSVDGGFRRIDREWFERHFWDIDRGWRVVERWALVIPA